MSMLEVNDIEVKYGVIKAIKGASFKVDENKLVFHKLLVEIRTMLR